MASPQRRVDLAYAAVGRLLQTRPRGADLLGLEIGLGDHERVLSFAEECELALVNTDATSGDERADAAAPIELAGG